MQSERRRILELVEKGTISAQEAIILLEALEKDGNTSRSILEKSQNTEDTIFKERDKQDSDQQSKSDSDFTKHFQEEMHDFRKDLSQIGTVFMDMMNTAVKKVKEFDVSSPFGEKVEFSHTEDLKAADVQSISVDLPNGNFTLEPHDSEDINVVCQVKVPFVNDSEEETRTQFLNQFVVKNEGGTLRIISQLKLAQVNVKVYMPQQFTNKISVKLVNGSATIRDITMEELKVKTLNGAIKGSTLAFNKAALDSSNGSIELMLAKGKELEAETLNGRVYIDGAFEEVDASSVNGHVVVTTTSTKSSKIKAHTVAGAVELYVPSTMSLSGKISTNFGKVDVGIQDASKTESQDQFLSKVVRFDKDVEGANRLFIEGESKTGAVLIRYTTTKE
ncbi:MAG: DUF4097 family beta strand repeat-containing protein [Lysinibacillus sp.]